MNALPLFKEDTYSENSKFTEIKEVILREYLQSHNYPWVIGFSGGKDSTLVVHLVFDMLLFIPEKKRKRKIYIVGNDTLVESPLIIEHLKKMLKKISSASKENNLPVEVELTEPDVSNTFWINIIGRGYPTPTRSFRWCTERMKIRPTKNFILSMSEKNDGVILLLGLRRTESSNRAMTQKKYDDGSYLNKNRDIPNCWIFKPIIDLNVNDVWEFLGENKPLWERNHDAMIKLYREARGGECPVVIGDDDPPSCGSTSPRFGCWTCTVVEKDRSLDGFVDAGYQNFKQLSDFRNWLLQIRDIPGNRLIKDRQGKKRYLRNGSIASSSFTLAVRMKILHRLLDLQKDYGDTLITEQEIKQIFKCWEQDATRDQETNLLLLPTF